jgi:hypothetical protein
MIQCDQEPPSYVGMLVLLEPTYRPIHITVSLETVIGTRSSIVADSSKAIIMHTISTTSVDEIALLARGTYTATVTAQS